jgi:hypothetical protein
MAHYAIVLKSEESGKSKWIAETGINIELRQERAMFGCLEFDSEFRAALSE